MATCRVRLLVLKPLLEVPASSEDADIPAAAGRAPAKSFGTLGDLLSKGGKKKK